MLQCCSEELLLYAPPVQIDKITIAIDVLIIFVTFSVPPEIEINQSWIRTSEGIEAEISCYVHAEPKEEVN